MKRWTTIALSFLLIACNDNTSPGADREAPIDPATRAAPQMSAGDALAGITNEAIQPEFLTDADLSALGGLAGKCAIRMTSVAFPAFVFEAGRSGVIKLNGKLISLPVIGDSRFAEDNLTVWLRAIDGEGNTGLSEHEMIVMLPGAKEELGFRGYLQCLPAEVGT